jgi:hypothetical protein
VRGDRLRILIAILSVAALTGLMLAAASTTAAERPAPTGGPAARGGWFSMVAQAARRPQAAVPQALLERLALIDRKLARLIRDVEQGTFDDELGEFSGPSFFRKRLHAIQADIATVRLDYFRMHGTSLVVTELLALDQHLELAVAFYSVVTEDLTRRQLGSAITAIDNLRGGLRIQRDLGEPVDDAVFSELARLRRKVVTLRRDHDAGIGEAELRRRVHEIEEIKHGKLLDLFPQLYGLTFRFVYLRLEGIDKALDGALESFQRGRKTAALAGLEHAKREKQKLEAALAEQAQKLGLALSVSHALLDDDPFRAVLCARIASEPGAMLAYSATGAGPDSFEGGADAATGTFTLSPGQEVVFASAVVVKGGTFAVEVEASKPGKRPVTRRKTYEVTTEAQGPFPCPSTEPEPPARTVECSGTLSFFAPGRMTVNRPAGPLEVLAALICTRPAGSAPRSPLGVAITRFDIQLPGDRRITSWLEPAGFSSTPVPGGRTTRCAVPATSRSTPQSRPTSACCPDRSPAWAPACTSSPTAPSRAPSP